MGRGRGKGKRGGRGGGGRRHFVSSLEELEARNDRDEAWAARRKTEQEEDDDSDSDESETEKKDRDGSDIDEDDNDGVPGASALPIPRGGDTSSMAVLEQKKVKTKGVEGLIEVENPNAKPKSAKMMKAKDMDMAAPPVELSRREREAIEAQRKKDHYMKLHAEGKTEEAQNDMARLAIVRKRREEAQARMAEEEAAAAAERAKMEKAAADQAAAGPQKLNTLEVKKMNPARLKELLKERGQSLQGSKKDLLTRLLEWEKNNHG